MKCSTAGCITYMLHPAGHLLQISVEAVGTLKKLFVLNVDLAYLILLDLFSLNEFCC